MVLSGYLREATQLVARLGETADGWEILAALDALGPDALAAVQEGLQHENWQVRRWCAAFIDRHGTSGLRASLIPLLHDAKSKVRVWAVHSLSCERCKDGESSIDVVPLLIERIRTDASLHVRRMAAAMLAYGTPDSRAVAVFDTLLARETDRKLRRHASLGLMRCQQSGMTSRPPGTQVPGYPNKAG